MKQSQCQHPAYLSNSLKTNKLKIRIEL